MTDRLSTLYQDLLSGSYDCVDRIVLNAYFRMGHDPGGFRGGWRALTGSDETLENTYLMRMAGRFSRRVRGYAKAHAIPVIDCPAGQRKHDLAEEYLAKTTVTQGLFLVLVGRAQAPVWDVTAKHHIERKKPMPYVNHYSFHILDPDWGHLTIKISGHPPFPAQVILNGHEYVACQARKAGIAFTKDGNCFTTISDAAGLAKIAETLSEHRAIGRLSQVCERWIYTCVCFALDFDEQKRSGFRYQYSNYQIEFSRNLIFEVGGHMDQVFQALIDRSRAPLDLKTIKTILGYRHRPIYRPRARRSTEWEVAVERPTYDLTIFKLHCGKLTLKIYTKGESGNIFMAIQDDLSGERRMAADLDGQMAPVRIEDMKRVVVDVGHRLFSLDVVFRADIPHRRLRPTDQDQKQTLGGCRLGEIFLGKVMLALPCRTVDHGNAVRLCVTANTTPEPPGQPHQIGVVQRVVLTCHPHLPDPEPNGIMRH